MKKVLTAALVVLALVPAAAIAQQRAGDAALGAVSGAIVLGPVGAVAGALVGYTAGPSIARSWGLRGSRSAKYRQRPRGETGRTMSSATPPPTRQAMEAQGSVQDSVQGSIQGSVAGRAGPPPVQAAAAPPQQSSAPPPVQGLE